MTSGKFDSGVCRFEFVYKSLLSGVSAGDSFLIAQQKDFAFAVEAFAHFVGGKSAPFVIVRGNEADDFRGVQRGVDHHGGDSRCDSFFHRTNQGVAIKGSQNDSIYVLADETFYDLDLLLAVVFAQRPLPDKVDIYFLRGQITSGFYGASVDTFPIFLCRSLGEYGDGVTLANAFIFPASGEMQRAENQQR